MPWTPEQMPDQTGRTAVVTGPTVGGLGYHTALELLRRGARVVLAGRSADKLAEARSALLREVPAGAVEQLVLDLTSLAAVRAAAAEAAGLGAIDLLVNNAGVMAPSYSRTVDGLEVQLATNHFGPFLLTGLLLPQLVKSGDGRVVTVASLAHRLARSAPLGEPRAEPRRYGPVGTWQVYAQSKLANLLFTYELDRRLRAAGLPVKALAAHPGIATTRLVRNGPLGSIPLGRPVVETAMRALFQTPAPAAWPTLMAATADLPGATFTGPGRPGELAGPAVIVGSTHRSHSPADQQALWDLSERTVGLTWP
ncbi:short chain dehydrogenase [Nocardioides terrae]|uniref:Short chain dehydrogenase n=1 Tax=Nocardioides terrae TaxID=574651 RepID=A0A1I1EVM4_9ACTN|nr:oxidoreductase [Nocardioides terrae]SFB90756.1 short chain dehydrogenase [Nocardioides terrae]